jgi:hypothetical protein
VSICLGGGISLTKLEIGSHDDVWWLVERCWVSMWMAGTLAPGSHHMADS